MLVAGLTDAFPSRYSQGAGLLHNSIPNLAQGVKQRIAAIVVFGDTYHVKDQGQIPGYPRNRFLAFCNNGDLVCHDASAKKSCDHARPFDLPLGHSEGSEFL